jgi:hypothetical protein
MGVATDKKHTVCIMEGYGKSSQKKSYEAFNCHINPGSTIIHNRENTLRKLVEKLTFKNQCYASPINPPSDHLEKVEKIINLVFQNPK